MNCESCQFYDEVNELCSNSDSPAYETPVDKDAVCAGWGGVAVLKPILFNTDMVRAILEDRETVTRRVMKSQPRMVYYDGELQDSGDDVCDGVPLWILIAEGQNGALEQIVPPYQPGDILYVRETFQIDYLSNIPGSGRIHYKSDDTYSDFTFAPARYEMMRRAQLKPGWRPNENMPREAARIFLRVTDVRVERLQDITEEQAVKEGFEAYHSESGYYEPATLGFAEGWDSTIKKADRALYGWEANPWVWVIEFEWCEKPEGE